MRMTDPKHPSIKSSPSSLIEWELLSNIGNEPAGVDVKSLEEFPGQGKHALFNDGGVRDEFDITQGHHMLFGLCFSSAEVSADNCNIDRFSKDNQETYMHMKQSE